jgi:uncharacterized protein
MNKLSQYIIDLGNNYYYNSYTDAIIKTNDELKNIDLTKDNLLIESLKSQGFVIDENQMEFEHLKFLHNRRKYNPRQASFIIYPSMQCNFNCYYCFEKSKDKIISDGNTELLKQMLSSFIENGGISKLSVRWSGGEPLLAWEKIKDILNELQKFKDITLLNTIATNGYLLNKRIVEEMVKFDFQNVVITIDGPKFIHDTNRKTKDGKPTFETIVKNIEYLCHYIPVTIRINIDKKNYQSIDDLLKELSEYKLPNRDIKIFCRPILPCWECKKDETMFEMSEFFELEQQYISLANKYGFIYAFHPNINSELRCPYYHINSFVIDSELNIYKCSLYVGEVKKSIGRIKHNNKIVFHENMFNEYLKSTNLDTLAIEECKNCKILPLCFGKCPILWEKSGYKENEGCIPEKQTIVEKIKYEYGI